MTTSDPFFSLRRPFVWLLPLLLLGFWLRLAYMQGGLYFYDEFISMLAAQMVRERGLPILPSGLFYDHGLLLSYISGALLALVGFKEEIARWPVLLFSVFTSAAYYAVARRLFNSPLAGLLAAALVTLDELSIIWGTRARMYSQAHLFGMLCLAFLMLGTLQRPSRRLRYLGLLCLAAALFSHTMTFLILPPLALLLLVFTVFYRPGSAWWRRTRLWPEALLAAAMVGAALAVIALVGMNRPSAKVIVQPDPALPSLGPLGLTFLQGFVGPGLGWTRFDNLFGFFEEPAYAWLLPLIAVALLISLYRLGRGGAGFAEVALLFLTLLGGLVIFEMGALLSDTWSKSRYIFIPALPAFLLVAAGSLAILLEGIVLLGSKLSRQGRLRAGLSTLATLAGLALVGSQGGPTAWNLAHARSTGDYHTAFAYVRAQWQATDVVMTAHPAAAFLYLQRCDYYANQVSASVFWGDGEDNALVDRYTGSPLIDSVEALNAVLAAGRRTWFVVDAQRLYERYELYFTQQIFAQMDLAYQTGQTYVFLSHPDPVPVPAEPATRLEANFSDVIRLEGYSLNPQASAEGVVSVGLFWRPTGAATRPYKVFVQLRNGQGQTIAQSDHFLWEGLLTLEVWQALQQQGEWLRDTAELRLPQPLPADGAPYRLYLGFYDPATLARVPLLNDTSGESAAVIDWPLSP
jgi:hypothetical protein